MAEPTLTINDIAASLTQAGERLAAIWRSNGWNTTTPAQQGISWMAPSISLEDILSEVAFAAERVKTLNKRGFSNEEGIFATRLKARADAFAPANLGSDPDAIIGNLLELINSVSRRIPPPAPPPPPPPKIDWEDLRQERGLLPKDLARRLRYVDARLEDLEPRSEEIERKIADIEAAHETAEELPTTLADLRTQKDELTTLMATAAKSADAVNTSEVRAADAKDRIEAAEADSKKRLDELVAAAENMIKRSEQALRGSTSVGLAKAFEARRAALAEAGSWWVGGLIAALLVALFVGWERLQSLKEVLNGTSSAATVWANAILAVLGVGAPVWFAWLSTKQIGTTFRLAEDYAFKASVSQAYEGYRAEAVEVDDALRERLLVSALTRIEEAPSRLLSPETHSSPLAELMNNPAIRKSLEGIPGISDKILALIPGKGGVAAAIVAPAAAAAAVAASLGSESEKPAAKE